MKGTSWILLATLQLVSRFSTNSVSVSLCIAEAVAMPQNAV